MLRRGLLQVHPKIVPAGSRRFSLPCFSCGRNSRLYFTEKNAHLQYRLPEILFKPVLFPSSRARPDTKLFPTARESGKEDAGKKKPAPAFGRRRFMHISGFAVRLSTYRPCPGQRERPERPSRAGRPRGTRWSGPCARTSNGFFCVLLTGSTLSARLGPSQPYEA